MCLGQFYTPCNKVCVCGGGYWSHCVWNKGTVERFMCKWHDGEVYVCQWYSFWGINVWPVLKLESCNCMLLTQTLFCMCVHWTFALHFVRFFGWGGVGYEFYIDKLWKTGLASHDDTRSNTCLETFSWVWLVLVEVVLKIKFQNIDTCI